MLLSFPNIFLAKFLIKKDIYYSLPDFCHYKLRSTHATRCSSPLLKIQKKLKHIFLHFEKIKHFIFLNFGS